MRLGAAKEPVDVLRDPRAVVILSITAMGITGLEAVAAILPSIGTGLGVSDARLGLVMTVFFLMAAIAIPVTGVLADLYGRRIVVVGSLLVFGCGGAGIAFVDSFEALLVLRALQGIGFAGTTPLTIVLAGDYFTGSTGSTVQGLRLSANGLTGIVAPAIAGVLAAVAWQYPFFMYLLAFPVAALVYFALPPVTDNDDSESSATATLRQYFAMLYGEFADRTLGVFVIGAFVVFFVRYGILTFMPLFAVRALGTDVVTAGLLVSLLGVARLVVAPTAGLAVRYRSRRILLAATIGLVALGTALIAVVPNVAGLVIALGIYGIGSGLFVPVLNDTVTSMTRAESRAGVVSGMNVFKNVAMALSPAFFGVVLAVASFRTLFVLMTVLPILYCVLTLSYVAVDDALQIDEEGSSSFED